jgi:hypothetical protein
MMGSKGLTYWTSETVLDRSEIAGYPQGSPPATNYVGCEARRRTCSEHETGTEELCEIKWDNHIVGMTESNERELKQLAILQKTTDATEHEQRLKGKS